MQNFPIIIKDLQVKEKVSLLSLGVHYLAYVILKGISLKYHFNLRLEGYFCYCPPRLSILALNQRHEENLTQLLP